MQRVAIQAGLILLSLLLHVWAVGGVWAVNFALVFLGFIAPPGERAENELIVVPIELVDLGEINNIAPVITPPEEEPEEEAPVSEPEEELLPEEEEIIEDPVDETLPEDEIEQTNPDTAPEEAVEEDVVPDLDAEPEPKVEEEEADPEPEPKEAPVVERHRDAFDDFLNQADSTFQSERETRKKTPEPRPQPQPKPLLEDTRPKPEPRRGAGERTGNTARLEALLYNYVKPCWQGVDDLPNPDRLNIRMRAELDENGNIRDLRLVEPARRPIGRDPMGIAVDRGLRAVRKCAPYKLPRDDFSEWQDIRINLGPAFEPN